MFDFDVLKISEASDGEGSDGGAGTRDEKSVLGLHTLRLDVRVTDIARAPALTLSPEAGLASAIEAMRQRERGAAVVVQDHRPVGVVTDLGDVTLPRTAARDRYGRVGAPEHVRAAPVAPADRVQPRTLPRGARHRGHLTVAA
jgi:CBS domain-containing protein